VTHRRPRARQSPGSADAAKEDEVRSTGIARPVLVSDLHGFTILRCAAEPRTSPSPPKAGFCLARDVPLAVSWGTWSIARSATCAPRAASSRADPAVSVCDEDREVIPRHQHDPPPQPPRRRRARSPKVQRVSAMRTGWRVFPSGFNCGPGRLRFGGDAEPAAPPSESPTARRRHSIEIRAVITLVWWLTSDHAKQGRVGARMTGWLGRRPSTPP
jgi:hypothetical protein